MCVLFLLFARIAWCGGGASGHSAGAPGALRCAPVPPGSAEAHLLGGAIGLGARFAVDSSAGIDQLAIALSDQLSRAVAVGLGRALAAQEAASLVLRLLAGDGLLAAPAAVMNVLQQSQP